MSKHRDFKLAEHYAHRGLYDNNGGIPENSMAAFRKAAENRIPVEFDIHLLADGGLAIFHDAGLERMTGVSGQIEDYDTTNLSRLRLLGTDEKIPMLDELLDLFEDTGIPLLVELKPERGNHRELTKAVCDRLNRYRGEYVIESFDPRVLIEYRKLRPDVIRGQLAQDFFKDNGGLGVLQTLLLSSMVMDVRAKPDFIAYKYEDRNYPLVRILIDKFGIPEASWTVKTPEQYLDAVRAGCTPIFENFYPGDL